MAKANRRLRVSQFFSLGRSQASLDFVDVPIGGDIPVFLDPSRIRNMGTTWASECQSLLQHFFLQILKCVQQGDQSNGLKLLTGLSERNEFHLGFSKNASQGSGIGTEFANDFWVALTKSKAGKTGLLKDLEDACLFIDGVGPDRISDATCNILRGPLIKYTQDMCRYYGIPMQSGVPSGPVWNPQVGDWNDALIELPVTPFGSILFVPKIAVRHRFIYDAQNYYSHYLLPEMQVHEKSINSSLVHTLKNGQTRVTKKSLRLQYGADKLTIAQQTALHRDVLDRYRQDAVRKSSPITHHKIAEVEKVDAPRFKKILDAVTNIPVGIKHASAYEDAIEALLTAIFYPSLCYPQKQHQIHEGRKRIDITYVNNANQGFFGWISTHYPAAHIFVECKNYGNEISNPEVDQLAGRFSPTRGQIGILICRSIKNKTLLEKRCADTARDHRGFIIYLTDDDLVNLVKEYTQSDGNSDYPLLRSKFSKLVM